MADLNPVAGTRSSVIPNTGHSSCTRLDDFQPGHLRAQQHPQIGVKRRLYPTGHPKDPTHAQKMGLHYGPLPYLQGLRWFDKACQRLPRYRARRLI